MEQKIFLDDEDLNKLANYYQDSSFHTYEIYYLKSEDNDTFRTLHFIGDAPMHLNAIEEDGGYYLVMESPE